MLNGWSAYYCLVLCECHTYECLEPPVFVFLPRSLSFWMVVRLDVSWKMPVSVWIFVVVASVAVALAAADVVIISFQNIVFSYRIDMIAWRYVADVHAVAVVIFSMWRGPGVGYCVGFIVSVHNLKMYNIVTWALSLTSILEFMFSIACGSNACSSFHFIRMFKMRENHKSPIPIDYTNFSSYS